MTQRRWVELAPHQIQMILDGLELLEEAHMTDDQVGGKSTPAHSLRSLLTNADQVKFR